MESLGLLVGHLVGDYILQNDFIARRKAISSPVCLLHCLLYTAAVWACAFWWMPWWGLVCCAGLHFPMDRWRLARPIMEHVTSQREFASAPFAPWSVIIVDNTIHLAVLFVIGVAALLPAA